jgi:hypothetical protein
VRAQPEKLEEALQRAEGKVFEHLVQTDPDVTKALHKLLATNEV